MWRVGNFGRVLKAAFLMLATVSCGAKMEGGSAEPPLASFAFPSDGVPNENRFVGPFCCTGRTAIVEDASGTAVGYSYFYSFDGSVLITDQQSIAGTISILVAGRTSFTEADAALVTSQIDFAGAELHVGATRSAIAGALEFEAVIDHIDLVPFDDELYFDMQTIEVSVSARPISGLPGGS